MAARDFQRSFATETGTSCGEVLPAVTYRHSNSHHHPVSQSILLMNLRDHFSLRLSVLLLPILCPPDLLAHSYADVSHTLGHLSARRYG